MKKMFRVKSFLLLRVCKDLLLKLSTTITTDYGVLNYRLIRPIHYHSHPQEQVWIKKNSQTIRNIPKQYEQRVVKNL